MKRLVVALAFLVAGCGAIPGLGSDGRKHDQLVRYAQCLRQQGIQVADPPPGEDSFHVDARGVPKDRFDAAMKTCKKYAPQEEPPSAEDLDRMRKTAACLRRNGVEASDPTVADPGIRVGAPPPGKDLDAIMTACRKEVGE
ncbi:hypothetical protein [Microbispora sp. ATCC PTA-5024]|uniref:hypothetical protein n=1 Tax=Microbispora sp. ATCC PTA-5024 TaxID=316330 RepID=UPI0003DCF696|nr:hypothetical protein [Microbispora sp. ATCC PTA-5024]ETK36195.1 hypothetical protein MPTA5024_11255 [Microbispora sp. ATCC PTA-5024]